MPSNNIGTSYVTVNSNTTGTINGLKAFTTGYINANSFSNVVEIDDIVTYSRLKEEESLDKIYQIIYDSFCKRFPEKAKEYEVLLKMHMLDYRKTVLDIEFDNMKKNK